MGSFLPCRFRCNSRHSGDGMRNTEKKKKIWKAAIDTAEIDCLIPAADDTNCSTRRNVKLLDDLYKAQEAVLAPARVNCSTTLKVLDLSRKEWSMKMISILESHHQVIANLRQATGNADAYETNGEQSTGIQCYVWGSGLPETMVELHVLYITELSSSSTV